MRSSPGKIFADFGATKPIDEALAGKYLRSPPKERVLTYKHQNAKVRFSMFIFWAFLISFAFGAEQSVFSPPNLSVTDRQSAVFIKILKADFEIVYHFTKQQTHIEAVIDFQTDSIGWPILDLVDNPDSIYIDDVETESTVVASPFNFVHDEKIFFRAIKANLNPGPHRLRIKYQQTAFPPAFTELGVNANFSMADTDPRGLLERYLPANFEFDQYPMTFEVRVEGTTKKHLVFTNGNLKRATASAWTVEFPRFFNSSCIFFALRPKESTIILEKKLKSVNGRNLLITIFSDTDSQVSADSIWKRLPLTLAYLERKIGPFPYSRIVLYSKSNKQLPMEYAGAAETGPDSLTHELAHSYFGRGILSANGNAGWIDEAIASYISEIWNTITVNPLPSNMAGHSVYFRQNDGNGYNKGYLLLCFLDQLFFDHNPKLSMNDFLVKLFQKRNHQIMTTEIFQRDLEEYSGMDLTITFNLFVRPKFFNFREQLIKKSSQSSF